MNRTTALRGVAWAGVAGTGCAMMFGAVGHAAITKRDRVTTRGLGRLHIGMSVQRAERVVGHRLRRSYPSGPRCFTAIIRPSRLGVYVLATGDTIARIDVTERGVATHSGIRVGDSVRRLRAAYGAQLKARPNFYQSSWTNYVIRDGNRKVVFYTDSRKVKSYSTGRSPEINYVEGCS